MKSINTPPTPGGMANILRALKERGKFGPKTKAIKKRTNNHNAHGNKWGSKEALKDFKKDYK